MARFSPYDYEPKTIHEVDGWNNDDPVKLNMTDGSHDPVNDPDPMRWLKEPDGPQYPSGGNPASGEPSAAWDKTGDRH